MRVEVLGDKRRLARLAVGVTDGARTAPPIGHSGDPSAIMVGVGMRDRLNEWADRGEIDGPPTPRLLVWSTSTWPRTCGLAIALGVWGFVRTATDPGRWGLGDDLAGLAGGTAIAFVLRLVVRRREQLREAAARPPSPVISSSE